MTKNSRLSSCVQVGAPYKCVRYVALPSGRHTCHIEGTGAW